MVDIRKLTLQNGNPQHEETEPSLSCPLSVLPDSVIIYNISSYIASKQTDN